jgi:RNA polymerase sigma-70 factor, ECF subfamily
MATIINVDSVLLGKIATGDHHAFQQLLERYQGRCYRLAWRELFQREEAEDVVQSVFLKLWHQPQSWRADAGASFSTWLYRVVINACIDAKRRRGRHTILNIDDHEAADTSDEQHELIHALKTLPEMQRHVVNLFYYEGLKVKEIAQTLDISEKSAESHLGRARKALKTLLLNDQGEERLWKTS